MTPSVTRCRRLHLLLAVCATVSVATPASAQREFRDCKDCPEMVRIPSGTFSMGSSAAEQAWAVAHGATPRSVSDESPQHTVTLRSFAIGKYDITRQEFAAFVRETGYTMPDGCYESGDPRAANQPDANWMNPGFAQTDRDPVVCVNWHDARAYINWLNGKVTASSAVYRLPTEAEWEYAARAAGSGKFWWGDDSAAAPAHAWYAANAEHRTHPVGSMAPNAFGLYDIVGNVWQWASDCYADDYTNAPAADSPDCLRVDRGGSLSYPLWLLRSATRERNQPAWRDRIMGFRVARTLP
jgi:formylglycine-generating enzyme required for sulfatase activity